MAVWAMASVKIHPFGYLDDARLRPFWRIYGGGEMGDRFGRVPRVLLGGRLDVLLASMLAALSLVLGLQVSPPGAVVLDVVACAAAAGTVRWPRVAGLILGLLLLGYFFVPAGSASLGQYAPLIPILGTGMRGLRSVRRWMAGGYGLLLVALQYQAYPDSPLFFLGALVWLVLIAALWLIGGAFAAYRHVEAEARSAALVQQRLALARDLHDTVARDLSRASLRAQVAQRSLDPEQMSAVVGEIQSALAQLRWTMILLRDPDTEAAKPSDDELGSPGDVLREATRHLESAGFRVAVTIEGSPDTIPASLWPTISAVVGEAASNIERHASRSEPCAMILSVDHQVVDMVFINEAADPRGTTSDPGAVAMGLLGVTERLAPIGGKLQTRQEGKQWMTQIRLPMGALASLEL